MRDGEQAKSETSGYERLIVWQRAHQLALATYTVTKAFPKDEKFGIISQMRRCAVSVPANIVEGYQRRSVKEKLNFFNIAHGSLAELGYYLKLTGDLGYLVPEKHSQLVELRDEVGRLLHGFIKSY